MLQATDCDYIKRENTRRKEEEEEEEEEKDSNKSFLVLSVVQLSVYLVNCIFIACCYLEEQEGEKRQMKRMKEEGWQLTLSI
jgi:hypothetical protein